MLPTCLSLANLTLYKAANAIKLSAMSMGVTRMSSASTAGVLEGHDG